MQIKRGAGVVLVLSLLVFSSMFVSAGFISDFWGKITGKTIAGQDTCVSSKFCLNNVYSTTGKQIDLYLPTDGSSGPWPVIAFFHPGGWNQGSENDCAINNYYTQYTTRGYAVACVGYRLTDGGRNPFPAQIHDAKAAVRWLKANSQKYNLDPNKVGALGGSAGGHLAAMLGTSYGDSVLEGASLGNAEQSSKVFATVVLQGPTYMLPVSEITNNAAGLRDYLGGDPNSNPVAKQRAEVADSRKYVDSSDGPFFLVYGTLDQLVKPANGIKLSQKLTEKGVPNTFIYCNGDHGCPKDGKFNEYMKFFDDNLKNRPATPPIVEPPIVPPLIDNFYSCNNNGKCDYFETRKNCASDCQSFRYGFSEPLVFNSQYKSSEGWNFDKGLQEMEKFGVKIDRVMMAKSICLNSITQINENSCIVFKQAAQKLIDRGITPIGLDTDLGSMITGYSSSDSFVVPVRDLTTGSPYMNFLNNYETSWYALALYLDNIHIWETGNEWNTGSPYMKYPTREMSDYEKAAVATDLMYRSKKAIKRANPDAFVFSPGFALQDYHGNPSNLHIIVDQIYKNIKSGSWPSNNPRDYFDGWAWHPYVSDLNRDFVSRNNRVLAIIAANGDENIPIYFSEIGTPQPSANYVQSILSMSRDNIPSLWGIGWYRLFSQPGPGTDGEFYLVNGPKTNPAYQWNSAGVKFKDISLTYKNTFGQGYTGMAIFPNGDCQKNYWDTVYSGKNNVVGMSNADNLYVDGRFVCLNSQFYECGWELNEPNFAGKKTSGQVVGNWKCDLANKRWVDAYPDYDCKPDSWLGKNNTVALWAKPTQSLNNDNRFICNANDTKIYWCASSSSPDASYWNTFSSMANVGRVIGNYTCDGLKWNLTIQQTPGVPDPVYTYSWQNTSWSACSAGNCIVGGTQTRNIECKRNDSLTVADSFCIETKPISSQSCAPITCPSGQTCSLDGSCSATPTPQQYSCIGNVFSNANLVSGDNLGLTVNVTNSLVLLNTSVKCEYTCNTGFNKSGEVCVPSTCNVNGLILNNGESKLFYSSTTHLDCTSISQTRTCIDGSLSGDLQYAYSSCSNLQSCALPWGGSIAHGTNVIAYQTSAVNCGSSCASQVRVCVNGVLSGSYSNQQCSVQACQYSCTGNVPANSSLISGDSFGLTANTAISLVLQNTSAKCEYTCNSGYDLKFGVCVKNQSLNQDCRKWFGEFYTGIHNNIGLSNGDPRFICFDKKLYECGWSKLPAGAPWFAVKAKDGQGVGSYVCDLTAKRWSKKV